MRANKRKKGKFEHFAKGTACRWGAKSVLALCLMAAFAVALTIGGTLAFLKNDTGAVTNTFKAGEITYKLTLMPNADLVDHIDGEVTMPSVLTAQSTTDLSVTFTADKTPTLEGYTFEGWYYEDDCTNLHTAAPGTSIPVQYGDTHDNNDAPNKVKITLYAKWTANEYTIKYDANSGTGTMADTEAVYDQNVNLRKNAFTKTGYTFTGWNTAADGSGTAYADEATVKNLVAADNGSITLYAQWEANEYTIKYDANTGIGTMADTEAVYDQNVNLRKNTFTKTGYTFSGWNTEANGGGTAYADEATVKNLVAADNGSITLYAQWLPNMYTVVYNGNGATAGSMDNSEHTYDVAKNLSDNAYTRTGYAFLGWSADPNATEKTYSNQQNVINLTSEPNGEVNLYAIWKQMDFKLTFDKVRDSATVTPATKTVTFGKAYGDLALAEDPHYKLVGWTFTKNGDDFVTKDTIVNIAADHTVYAKWVASTEYTITYYANATDATFNGGAKQITNSKLHDSSYTIKTPTELGVNRGSNWTWTEWNTKPDGTGTRYLGTNVYTANQDLTLYAIWKTKTAVTFGTPQFVNMAEPSRVPGKDDYNFIIKCQTRGGADGISIPVYNLNPGYAYRLTFSVSFNDFKFYTEDSHGYIFGTNIVEDTTNYHSQYSIIEKTGATVTHKYENMQWSTEQSGTYNVTLDFEASQETMYWFWETTDIVDFNEMQYVFNNFNIHMLKEDGPYGPRVAFEDLTVKFDEAPNIHPENITGVTTPIDTSKGHTYGTRWTDYKNGGGQELTARHKNYFHTEYYGFDNLQYRLWGYNGHEVMTIPIEGLEVGKTYELSFTQDLSNAIVYNTSGLNSNQLYGCAVTAKKDMDASYTTSNSVNKLENYQDLRKAKVGASSNQSVVFKATAETMYWQWLLGDLVDGRSSGWKYSVVKLSNVNIRTSNKAVTAASLDLKPEVELPEYVTMGEEVVLTAMPDVVQLEASVDQENMDLYGWAVEGFFGTEIIPAEELEAILEGVFADAAEYGDEVELHLFPLYQPAAPAEPDPTDPSEPATQPTNPNEPVTQPTDPSEPATQPTNPNEPVTQPTDPSEPATQPTNPSESVTQPTDPSEPATQPTDPSEPVIQATDPTEPSVASNDPTDPSELATEPSVAAADPTDPATLPPEETDPTEETKKGEE